MRIMTDEELLKLGEDILDGKVQLIFPRGNGKHELAFKIASAVVLAAEKRRKEQNHELTKENQKTKKTSQKT